MGWVIIGYGPKSEGLLTFVPEYILIQQNGEIRCILKSHPKVASEHPVPGVLVPVDTQTLFFDDTWVAIEEKGISVFRTSQELEWRSRRAQELAQEAVSCKGNPLRTIALSESAGRLQNLDISGLIRRLQVSRIHPNESLEEILQRIHSQK